MKEIGIDISGQAPKQIDLQAVLDFDLIVSFGCIAKAVFPAKERLEEWLIDDPKGQRIRKFREVSGIIQQKVKELISRLEGNQNEHG